VSSTEFPNACVLGNLTPEQRVREQTLLKHFREATLEMMELANGYSFRLANDSATLLEVAEFITLERLCCPFFSFELCLESNGGPLWLRLTGRDGVKEFLASMLKT
jgi:hypothetical protein